MESPPIGDKETVPRLDGEGIRLWSAAKVSLCTAKILEASNSLVY